MGRAQVWPINWRLTQSRLNGRYPHAHDATPFVCDFVLGALMGDEIDKILGDHHGAVKTHSAGTAKEVDQGCAALLKDLKQRDMLKDTLVIWGGEFGRTVYSQGALTKTNYGRDHHPRCFSLWMAGGGVKGGHVHGQTDEFGYNIVKDPVHVHDLHATMQHLLGVDHERQTFKFQGRYYRLTDVAGTVVKGVVA